MTEPEVPLRGLIDAVGEGDGAAFERLYNATRGKLYGVVLRILRKPNLAEVALPEAYLRIWADAANYEPSLLDAESWLVMQARRAAIDLARQRAELGREEVAESPEQAGEAEPDPSRDMSDELRALLACLAKLDPDPRLMLLLAYYDGWSRADLAIEFDAQPGTIRTWMLRGLEQIRDSSGPA